MIARFALSLVFVCFMTCPSPAQSENDGTLRVMSFNVRLGSANDGEHRWDLRKELLVETIRGFDPDLLGTQETLSFQRDFLEQNLPGYEVLGVGREDGIERGEMMAVFYRADRFEQLDAGHFWLSETPDVPGSRSWDTAWTRVVTWVRLRDRLADGQPELYFFNTHFDNESRQARTEAAKLFWRHIADLEPGANVILTGDFNTGEETVPYNALFASREDGATLLRDVYRVAHPQRSDEEGTFQGFDPTQRTGARIDWIAATSGFEVVSADIDHTTRDGRPPSDHFPVTAVLKWTSGE